MDQTPTWAKHWRRKAEKARAAAAKMSDNELKQQMFALAATYEHLARRAVGKPTKATARAGAKPTNPLS